MNYQKGDISVYIALLVLGVIISSSLLFTLVLTRQLKATEEVMNSERSFYAAATGLEQGLYALSQKTTPYLTNVSIPDPNVSTPQAIISYPDTNETATYQVAGILNTDPASKGKENVCLQATGTFHGFARNIKLGPKDCAAK